MKRLLKILLWVVGVLVALVVIAMAALLLFFDPNDYKAQIDAAIERQIGREVDISGDLGLSVFPWLGVELGRVTVANASGFGDQPMAAMNSAELSVRLLPLLSREFEVGTVGLNGLRLRLARNAEGRTNWADISEHLASSQGSENDGDNVPEDSESGSGGFELSSLQISAVKVADAAVSWRDATTGADYRATDVSLETGRLSDGEPFRLEFGGQFAAPAQGINGQLDVAARVEPNIAERFYRFSDLSISLLAAGDAVPGEQQQASLSAAGDLDMAEGRFRLANVTLQAAGLNITGNVDGSGLNDTPSYNGRITVKEFDPRAVMQQLTIEPPATQASGALSSAGLDAQFDADNENIHLKQILATLDDSDLKGTATVRNFSAPEIGFDMSLDQLNVDDYLPPGSAEQAKTDQPAQKGGGQEQREAEIDLSILDSLRLDGKLAVGSLTAANIHVTNADVAVKARDGVLTIEPLSADLYDGNVRMQARVDASGDTPRYSLKGNLNGLQFAPLLKDVAGTDRVAALANMNIDIRTQGKQVASMKRALDGNFGFDLRDGAFSGFNLAQVIAAARSRLSGDGEATAKSGVAEDETTPFNRFDGAFNINDGVLSSSKALEFNTRVLNAKGSGQYDLAANALDYTVDALIPDDASGALEELAGLTIPIKLSGNLLSPSYKLDIASALRGAAEQRVQEEKSKLQDKARKKIEEKTQDLDKNVRDRIQQGVSSFFGGGSQSDADSEGDSNDK